MIISESLGPNELAAVSAPRLLISVDDFIEYKLWRDDLSTNNVDAHKYAKSLILSKKNEFTVLGDGHHYRNPAVFACFAHNTIAAAGEVQIVTANISTYNHLPMYAQYALIGNARTNQEFRNRGLNAQVTNARINWALEHDTGWAKAYVRISNNASLVPKLKNGFVIENAQSGLEGEVFELVYPLHYSVEQQMGIQDRFEQNDGEIMSPLQAAEQADRFETEYGVLQQYDASKDDVLIRMVPRILTGQFAR